MDRRRAGEGRDDQEMKAESREWRTGGGIITLNFLMKKTTTTKHRKASEMSSEYRLDYTKTKPNRFAKRIPISRKKIAEFCQRWQISEFSFFGLVLRDDFRPDSDVDVLVSFQPESKWSLWDLIEMQEELEKMFSRKVDFVEQEAIRNPYRRHSILNGREIFYAAS